MTAQKLDGTATAAAIKEELRGRVAALLARGITPGLGTILVGDDPGSRWYVNGKHKDCAEVGIESIRVDLPETASQAEVEAHEVGLAILGSALIAAGSVDEGLAQLDESAALAVGEDFTDVAAPGWALCHTVSACIAYTLACHTFCSSRLEATATSIRSLRLGEVCTSAATA